MALHVVSRDERSATLELRTGGFYALHEPAGSVRVFVQGFDFPAHAEAAALPLGGAVGDGTSHKGDWYAAVLTLCVGGLLLSMPSVIVGWRFLRK